MLPDHAPSLLERRAFDYSDLEAWMAHADQVIRDTRRTFDALARSEVAPACARSQPAPALQSEPPFDELLDAWLGGNEIDEQERYRDQAANWPEPVRGTGAILQAGHTRHGVLNRGRPSILQPEELPTEPPLAQPRLASLEREPRGAGRLCKLRVAVINDYGLYRDFRLRVA